jgi:lysozyme
MSVLLPEAIEQMKHHEGVRQKPYLCPAHIWTVGVGRVLYHDQIKLPMVRKGEYTGQIRREYPIRLEDSRLWSMEEVDELLRQDLQRFTLGVDRLCPVTTDGQKSALVSFSFNVGLGNLQRSSVRMRHNRGDYEGAAEAFMMWTKAGGRELPGLVKRRLDEKNLYSS